MDASLLEQARFRKNGNARDVTEVHLPQWTDVLEVIRGWDIAKFSLADLIFDGRIEEFTERTDAPARVDRTEREGSDDQPASLNQSAFFAT